MPLVKAVAQWVLIGVILSLFLSAIAVDMGRIRTRKDLQLGSNAWESPSSTFLL